jgi:hypothetical protein
MAAVYTVLFGAGTTTAGAATTIYTAPSGMVSILRDCELVTSGSGTTASHSLYVAGLALFWFVKVTVPSSYFQWTGRLVIPPGGALTIASATQNTNFYCTGYQLVGP